MTECKNDLTFVVRAMHMDADKWSFQQPTAKQMQETVDSWSA